MGCGPSSAKAATSPGDAPKPAPKMVQRQPPGSSSDSTSSATSASSGSGRTKSGAKSNKIHDDYEFLEVLGKGGFGEVRRAKRKSDGKVVAIKTISKLQFKTEQDHKDMLMEVELMGRVRGHPNVVEQLDWYEDRTGFFVVAELVTGGELMDRLIKMTHFSEKVAAHYFRQMCEALAWCHTKGVVHRDLKPENFLLGSHEPKAVLKVTDFGLSCSISHPDDIITDACGSAYYIAPEIFKQRYTRAVDVWALGIILYLLLSGTVPFGASAESEQQVYSAIQKEPLTLQGSAWAAISPSAKELVRGLLEKDPAKRYTLEQALAHPWVRGESAPDIPLDRALLQSITTFQANNRFKKKALELVASTLSAADVTTLRAAFVKMDKDGSGTLSPSEVEAALREAGLASNKEAVLAAVRNMDSNGDGKVSWQEFLAATAQRQLINYQNNMWYAFQVYDKDGDGNITVEELRAIFKDEPEEKVQRYIAEFDTDGDGTIDYAEFIRMLLPSDTKYTIAPAAAGGSGDAAASASGGSS